MTEYLDHMMLAFVLVDSPDKQHSEQLRLSLRNGNVPRGGPNLFHIQQQGDYRRPLISQNAQLLGIELRIADGAFNDRPKQLKLFSADFGIAPEAGFLRKIFAWCDVVVNQQHRLGIGQDPVGPVVPHRMMNQ